MTSLTFTYCVGAIEHTVAAVRWQNAFWRFSNTSRCVFRFKWRRFNLERIYDTTLLCALECKFWENALEFFFWISDNNARTHIDSVENHSDLPSSHLCGWALHNVMHQTQPMSHKFYILIWFLYGATQNQQNGCTLFNDNAINITLLFVCNVYISE